MTNERIEELLLELIGSVRSLDTKMNDVTGSITKIELHQATQNGRVFALADRVNSRTDACPLLTPVRCDIERIQVALARRDAREKTNTRWLAASGALIGSGLTMLARLLYTHFWR